MESVRGYMKNHFEHSDSDEAILRSEQEMPREELQMRRSQLGRIVDQDSSLLEKIPFYSRILIIEGISGSGKDTFQKYLKKKLHHRDVYDFSEGELLHSWKHIPIKGVLKLKIQFMKIFVNYLEDMVTREENAVFLLNRFHLSTYAAIKTRQPELKREYDRIVNVLRMLPVHVFILHLDENEIEQRSLHPERSGVWSKLQRQMVANDGFRGRLEKYISQQSLMLEGAKRQRIPYSIIKCAAMPEFEAANP